VHAPNTRFASRGHTFLVIPPSFAGRAASSAPLRSGVIVVNLCKSGAGPMRGWKARERHHRSKADLRKRSAFHKSRVTTPCPAAFQLEKLPLAFISFEINFCPPRSTKSNPLQYVSRFVKPPPRTRVLDRADARVQCPTGSRSAPTFLDRSSSAPRRLKTPCRNQILRPCRSRKTLIALRIAHRFEAGVLIRNGRRRHATQNRLQRRESVNHVEFISETVPNVLSLRDECSE